MPNGADSHLAISDVAAGQAAVPHLREEPASYRPTATARQHGPLRSRAGRQIRDFSRATPSFRHASGDTLSSWLPRSIPGCLRAETRGQARKR
jgi:hypothetical protein